MDIFVGSCQIEVHQRLAAEQVANHYFVLSFRKWSAEMDMISVIAPLLRHMPPGNDSGHGIHAWMMTTVPAALQYYWALELIGAMLKYPF